MATNTLEYDAFGPWIDEVKTTAEVPRLYRDHPLDLDAARLVLKVPREIARRDATADMDLYDHLLVLQERRLTVLSRRQDGRAGGYETRQVDLADIAAVLDEVNLLDGRLSVHTRDGQVLSLAYNGSARNRVRQLVEGLRIDGSGTQPPNAGHELTHASLGRDDVAVVADVREVAQTRPDLIPLAWHGRTVLHPLVTGPAGVLGRLTHVMSPMTLQAAVVARDADYLEVFGRRDWLVRGRRPVHSASRLVIPLRILERVQARPNPRYARAVDLFLSAGRARLQVTVPQGSAAERTLKNVTAERPA